MRIGEGRAWLWLFGYVVLGVTIALGSSMSLCSAEEQGSRLGVSEDLGYLGQHEGVPLVIAQAGLSADAMAWSWSPGWTVSTRGEDPWCSAHGHWDDFCSVEQSPSIKYCSTEKVSSGNPAGPNCSAVLTPGADQRNSYCSAKAKSGNTRQCSVSDNSVNDECSSFAMSGSASAECSVMQGDGAGSAECSSQAPAGGGGSSFCSASSPTSGSHSSFCSAGNNTTSGDFCSVNAGSGDTCTVKGGAGTEACSSKAGGSGQCSSRAANGTVTTGPSCS